MCLLFLLLAGVCLLWAQDDSGAANPNEPSRVSLIKGNGVFRLLVDEKAFFVKGAGADRELDELAAAGANTVRTWGADQLESLLDTAAENGLYVAAGLWVEHERHGFDYNDEQAVARQIQSHKAVVDRFKNHPAILMWFVGNEVELQSTNPKVWEVVESVCQYIQQVDPNHPVGTVTAHPSPDTVQYVLEKCPSVQIYGVNSYAGISVVADDLRSAGWTGPFMVTEWGPNGHWEVGSTSWGAPIEQTSTDKAEMIAMRYKHILEERDQCLGSFLFFWGQKQEVTSTWYGVYTKEGRRTETIERMTYLWSDQYPGEQSPRIANLSLNGMKPEDNLKVESGEGVMEASFDWYRGMENESSEVVWQLYLESTDRKLGGDAEAEPEQIPIQFEKPADTQVRFLTPIRAGNYRLFLEVRGPGNTATTANFPFQVVE